MPDTRVFATSDGVEITCKIYGELSPKALLLCPGLGATQLCFASDAEFFAAKDYCVVTVDLRGHGMSSAPYEMRPQYFTLDKLASDLSIVMESLGLNQVSFVGNSLGGGIGLELIQQKNQRLHSLCTFGTTYHLKLPKIQAYIQYLTAKMLGTERLSSIIAKSSSENESARRLIKAMYRKYDARVARCIAVNICQYDYREAIAGWHKPVLLLKGEKDISINKHLATTLDLFRSSNQCNIQDIPGAGHFTNLDNPLDVRKAVLSFIGDENEN